MVYRVATSVHVVTNNNLGKMHRDRTLHVRIRNTSMPVTILDDAVLTVKQKRGAVLGQPDIRPTSTTNAYIGYLVETHWCQAVLPKALRGLSISM